MRDIAIIIPTMAVMGRKDALRRAVESVLSQENVDPRVIVVANGGRHEADVLAQFDGNDRVQIVIQPEPNVSQARLRGRELVTSTYFGFLDDDDAFLPLAIAARVDALEADATLDVVATNGYYEADGHREIIFNDFLLCENDPMMALMDTNWLCSCGGLYRTATVGRDIFANLPRAMEVTLIAFRLTRHHKILRLDRPTFVVHQHDFERLSQSDHYHACLGDVLEIMYTGTDRHDIRQKLSIRMEANNHDLSVRSLDAGRLWNAWCYHLKSMSSLRGLRYFSFTRYLLMALVKRDKRDAVA